MRLESIPMKVYVDTSVFGGCFDDEYRKWSTRLFRELRQGTKCAIISDITIKELENAPQKVKKLLDILPDKNRKTVFSGDEDIALATAYINEGAITARFYNDALHIAIATINKVDVLVSWNFKHIVNLNRIRLYNSVNLKRGYSLIEIRSPMEVLNEA
ncbi:MAG: PIN domain-containing protein [Proteobacteria bacterium]|nr:PIN domain-containing protein [Pseudomonadota bacterium]